MYDWANSAFMTTIIAAVFPVYFYEVAADGMDPDAAFAEQYTDRLTELRAEVAAYAGQTSPLEYADQTVLHGGVEALRAPEEVPLRL